MINIGPKEQFKRLKIGIIAILASIAAGSAIVILDLNRFTALLLFIPNWIGVVGVLQASEKT
ncbi:MAG: hypothetical protein HY606_11575 [Planctomycetes bacterium]|nr:hypothetical protein [Planctomycetota bacterium]